MILSPSLAISLNSHGNFAFHFLFLFLFLHLSTVTESLRLLPLHDLFPQTTLIKPVLFANEALVLALFVVENPEGGKRQTWKDGRDKGRDNGERKRETKRDTQRQRGNTATKEERETKNLGQ